MPGFQQSRVTEAFTAYPSLFFSPPRVITCPSLYNREKAASCDQVQVAIIVYCVREYSMLIYHSLVARKEMQHPQIQASVIETPHVQTEVRNADQKPFLLST